MATEEQKTLVLARLKAQLAQMPEAEKNFPIVMTMQGALSVPQLIYAIENNLPIGEEYMTAELKKLSEVYGIIV